MIFRLFHFSSSRHESFPSSTPFPRYFDAAIMREILFTPLSFSLFIDIFHDDDIFDYAIIML